MTYLRKFELPLFAILFSVLLWTGLERSDRPYDFEGDDLRYISYAVAMQEHGIFGLQSHDIDKAPQAGNANAPLYPVMIATIMMADAKFYKSMVCVTKSDDISNCPQEFDKFYMVQVFLGLLTLYFIYLIALQLSKNRIVGWLAAILAFASGILQEFAAIFMTEILILPAFCALLLFCLRYYNERKWPWLVAIAAALAFLTLTRPSYLYLFDGFVIFFGAVAMSQYKKETLINLAVIVAAFALFVAPWSLRNKAEIGTYSLTSGGYGEAILVQRINYNQMGWDEVGAAMIYWLPDFGDSLAAKIFPEPSYEKLGWDDRSYYAQGYGKQVEKLEKELGSKSAILPHLVKTEILTPKHVAVSIPLAIRGTFIAKYWGLVGFIAFLALLLRTWRSQSYGYALMALPLFYMVAFHAGLSVSIPRYNLPLMALYAPAMAIYLYLFVIKLFGLENGRAGHALKI